MPEQQKHPIESLMKTTMENMKDMIDVDTIVGNPVETSNGSVLIPISKVSFGFASGGGEYNKNCRSEEDSKDAYPFAGGTGAGITVQPVAFMVVEKEETKLMYVDQNANMLDNILNKTPKLMENIQGMFSGKGKSSGQSNNQSKKQDENKQENEDSKNNKEEN
ncbi:GerW family sporulation protein [Tepidibacter hydrothermalis]|uniref:GerW family sporulation protein n=1 Tax=Tepidibacter hydrothermalis TaxID=3036126 RepID=A0ABY8E7D2_9FIRM|nr:GerW family sporulation protein [Tepidibacter hydrothermalis]WFD08792.1 GerW family sporulation protein [Tepidibacter hydrothermalis]